MAGYQHMRYSLTYGCATIRTPAPPPHIDTCPEPLAWVRNCPQPGREWLYLANGFGALALFPIILPTFVCIALLLWITSDSPIIEVDTWVRAGRAPVRLFRFRTAPAQAGTRPSWVNRFLRATGLDELPMLWNVLSGEMLIGERAGWRRIRSVGAHTAQPSCALEPSASVARLGPARRSFSSGLASSYPVTTGTSRPVVALEAVE